MYSRPTQSILNTRHIHKLITLSPGKGEDMDTVLRCATCDRIVLMEPKDDGGAISSHQCLVH